MVQGGLALFLIEQRLAGVPPRLQSWGARAAEGLQEGGRCPLLNPFRFIFPFSGGPEVEDGVRAVHLHHQRHHVAPRHRPQLKNVCFCEGGLLDT